MDDIFHSFRNLRRPSLLFRAAKLGLATYRREHVLRRIGAEAKRPEACVARLLAAEEQIEQIRKSGDASYSLSRHVEILVALMAEMAFLRRRSMV